MSTVRCRRAEEKVTAKGLNSAAYTHEVSRTQFQTRCDSIYYLTDIDVGIPQARLACYTLRITPSSLFRSVTTGWSAGGATMTPQPAPLRTSWWVVGDSSVRRTNAARAASAPVSPSSRTLRAPRALQPKCAIPVGKASGSAGAQLGCTFRRWRAWFASTVYRLPQPGTAHLYAAPSRTSSKGQASVYRMCATGRTPRRSVHREMRAEARWSAAVGTVSTARGKAAGRGTRTCRTFWRSAGTGG